MEMSVPSAETAIFTVFIMKPGPLTREVFSEGRIEIISGKTYTKMLARIGLGAGKASAVGIHVGSDGAKSLVQQSTGAIVTEAVTPAFTFTSGMRSWIQR
jgi:hypothetical protein